jgi:hypothetical protein
VGAGRRVAVWHYEHCGLRIASEIAIPDLAPVAAGENADVRIALGEAVTHEQPEDAAIRVTERASRIRFPGVADYEVHGGERIVVRPDPATEDLSVSLFLLGSVWACLLHQRGSFPLHAGVTADGEGAVAFCGPRGAGKSSTVARLLNEGHRLVSDDLTRLDVGDEGPPLVWPSTARLKLSS